MVAAAVLVGGRSRRFGSSKALALVDGVPMAERVATVLEAGGCQPVVFIGGSDHEVEALASTRRMHMRDRWPGEGPLGGVLSALLAFGSPVVVAACDLVDLDAETARAVMVDSDADVVIAVAAGTRRALARWQPSSLHGVLEHFSDGERALLGTHLDDPAMRVHEVAVDPEVVTDHNRPDALAAHGRLSRNVVSAEEIPHVGQTPPIAMVSAVIPHIDIDGLASLLEAGPVRLVDVRETDEFETGHVPGAVSIPLSELSDRVDELRGDDDLYVICAAGSRSQMACEFASSHGIDAINVDGGTGAWVRSGRAVVIGDS